MIDRSRSAVLLGADGLARLAQARVLIVGVGGVGGWCAEALVRTGVTHLTVVDDDVVVASNVNRQCAATAQSIGRPKVEALAERLRAIDPEAEIVPLKLRYPDSTLDLSQFDAVVDAIDSVHAKTDLIRAATQSHGVFVSSMGAARRLDPTRVRLVRFDKIAGDGLARAVRQQFKKDNLFPARKFFCAVSDELPIDSVELGSVMTVTCTFGMVLAAEVVRQLISQQDKG